TSGGERGSRSRTQLHPGITQEVAHPERVLDSAAGPFRPLSRLRHSKYSIGKVDQEGFRLRVAFCKSSPRNHERREELANRRAPPDRFSVTCPAFESSPPLDVRPLARRAPESGVARKLCGLLAPQSRVGKGRARKGVPVLLRQYLKIGGEVLAFNVDQEFLRRPRRPGPGRPAQDRSRTPGDVYGEGGGKSIP